MTRILVAHAPAAKRRAGLVIGALAALGYRVEAAPASALAPHKRRALADAVAAARAVIVLWSKEAADAPALRAAADRALAAGKLTLARLDASTPPLRLRSLDLSRWSGFAGARAWRRLVAALPTAPAAASAKSRPAAAAAAAPAAPAKKRGGALALALAALALLAAAGAGAYYAWSAGLIG